MVHNGAFLERYVRNWPMCFRWGSLLATGLALLLCHMGRLGDVWQVVKIEH